MASKPGGVVTPPRDGNGLVGACGLDGLWGLEALGTGDGTASEGAGFGRSVPPDAEDLEELEPVLADTRTAMSVATSAMATSVTPVHKPRRGRPEGAPGAGAAGRPCCEAAGQPCEATCQPWGSGGAYAVGVGAYFGAGPAYSRD